MSKLAKALAAFLIVMVLTGQGAVHAQDSARIDAIEAAWRSWVETNRARSATLAIAYRGKIVKEVAKGRDARDTVSLASLSKSITGACVQTLIDTGKLSANTPLSSVFGPGLRELGLSDSTQDTVTIAQLLTHTSGLMPDATQGAMKAWRKENDVRHRTAARTALGRPTQSGTLGQFRYNNENYAILGEVISTLSGQSYTQYCRDAVLRPHGVTTAVLDADFGAYAAWGGWAMSSADFLRFVTGAFDPETTFARDPRQFAHIDLGNGIYYGPGTLFRTRKGRSNFWHFGSLCFGRRDNRGSYFAYWRGGWAVMATYALCLDDSGMLSLDQALGGAALR